MQRSSFKEPVDSKGVFRWMEKFNRTLGLDQDSQCSPEDYNWSQLRRYTIYGCALAGPLLYGWYRWLDATYTGTSTKIVLKKLFVDQFILTPPLIMLFFVSMSLMEGRASVLEECKSKFVKTFRTSCLYWIPVQFMNFLLVPPSFRVLYVSVASFCWVNILCYLKSLPANRDEPMQGSST
ncbi:mpv17-like protein 2 isoform X2 [Orussus abietinus]|nr:mpv17-like protein 2 isoform X2 [Orussus abietinus]